MKAARVVCLQPHSHRVGKLLVRHLYKAITGSVVHTVLVCHCETAGTASPSPHLEACCEDESWCWEKNRSCRRGAPVLVRLRARGRRSRVRCSCRSTRGRGRGSGRGRCSCSSCSCRCGCGGCCCCRRCCCRGRFRHHHLCSIPHLIDAATGTTQSTERDITRAWCRPRVLLARDLGETVGDHAVAETSTVGHQLLCQCSGRGDRHHVGRSRGVAPARNICGNLAGVARRSSYVCDTHVPEGASRCVAAHTCEVATHGRGVRSRLE